MKFSSRYWLISVCFAFALLAGGCINKRTITAATPTPTPIEIITMVPTPAPPIPTPEVRAVEFSDDRKWLAVGTLTHTDSETDTITVRDCATNRVVKTWEVPDGVRFLAWSPDSTLIATTGVGMLAVWNWRSGKLVYREKNSRLDWTFEGSLDFSPDGRALAMGADNIFLFDTKTWKRRKLFPDYFGEKPNADPLGDVVQLRFRPDGRSILVTQYNPRANGDGGFALVSPAQKKVTRIDLSYFTWHAPVFSRDGRQVAAQGYCEVEANDGPDQMEMSYVLDARTLKRKRKFASATFQPHAFSSNGRLLAGIDVGEYGGSNSDSGPVEVWSVNSGKRVQRFDRFEQTARAVAWLDNKTLLAGDETGVRRLHIQAR